MVGRVILNNVQRGFGWVFACLRETHIVILALREVQRRGARSTVSMADIGDVEALSLLKPPSSLGGNQVRPRRGLEVGGARREPHRVLGSP